MINFQTNTRWQSVERQMQGVSRPQRQSENSTAGLLNPICELYGVNFPKNSVHITSLIKAHKPESEDFLVKLVRHHAHDGVLSNCECGNKSAGSIKDFAQALWEAQMEVFDYFGKKELAFTRECCLNYIYTLFISYSLKGSQVEGKVVDIINELGIEDVYAGRATPTEDSNYAIDVIAYKAGDLKLAIQVKPTTYKRFAKSSDVVQNNHTKNSRYTSNTGIDVFYLYYTKLDNSPIVWDNLEELIIKLNN